MDPIQRKNAPNIQAPQTPAVGPADATAKKFEIGQTAAGNTAATQGVARPAFDQMASQIQDAVARSLTRDQVRDELIGNEVKRTFGDDATPAMTASVSEAFKNDPHLSQLFNQLYSKAVTK